MNPRPSAFEYETAILGLGCVGIPLALGFAGAGCRTLGIDIDPERVRQLQEGTSPLPYLPASRIAAATGAGLLEFTDDPSRISRCGAVIICVPTPLGIHLNPNLSHIIRAGEDIGAHLRRGMLVSLESSTYPGTTRDVLRRVLEEKSGLRAGVDFALAFSPEREDPGNGNSILGEMPKVVSGLTGECLERAVQLYSRAVKRVVPVANCDTAEAVKLTENIFRFVNIALVNELKRIYTPMGIDIWEVIQAASTKPFGFMPFYPGAGVGGHCIPIDPYYLTWRAREFGLHTCFIDLAGQINRAMPGYVVSRLAEGLNDCTHSLNGCRVLVLGVAYKQNISDDRESPSYEVMNLLKKQGADVDYYDPLVPVIQDRGGHNPWAGRRSIAWTRDHLGAYGAAVVCTAHQGVDYAGLADALPLIVDACNVVPRDQKARVIAA